VLKKILLLLHHFSKKELLARNNVTHTHLVALMRCNSARDVI